MRLLGVVEPGPIIGWLDRTLSLAMDGLKHLNKRYFTDAARAAAAEARRRKREAALLRDTLEVFVVRLHPEDLKFGWEIRRFGAVVVGRSESGFTTMETARQAGRQALASQEA